MHFIGVFCLLVALWMVYNLAIMPRQRPCDVCGDPDAIGVPKAGSHRRLFAIGWHKADTMFVCHEHVITYLRLQTSSPQQ